MVTIYKLFFWRPELKNFYGHINLFFQRLFLIFQKWTKINVQKSKIKKSLGKKYKKIASLSCFGNILYSFKLFWNIIFREFFFHKN